MARTPQIEKETIQILIDTVAEGNTLRKAFAIVKKTNPELRLPTYLYFHRLIVQFELEEEYFNACQAKKIMMEEKLYEELDQCADTVAAEVDPDGNPYKFINNTAAVQKIEIKRRMLATNTGRIEKFNSFKGITLAEKIASLTEALQTKGIASADAMQTMNFLEKEQQLHKYSWLESQLLAMADEVKSLKEKSK